MNRDQLTLIFVPGAFHTGAVWSRLMKPLRAAGYDCKALSLPSVVSPHKHALFDPFLADIAEIRAAILAAAHLGKGVVLIAHSYAGLPASSAVDGLRVEDRAPRGLLGGVIGFIGITASIRPVGQSLASREVGTASWACVREDGTCVPVETRQEFYSDMTERKAARFASGTVSQSHAVFFSPVTFLGSAAVQKSGYLVCEADVALQPERQRAMANLGQFKVIETLEGAGHSPMLSRVRETASFIMKVLA